jgi:hypothetical protein
VLVPHPNKRRQEHANCTAARTSVVENNSERKEKLLLDIAIKPMSERI